MDMQVFGLIGLGVMGQNFVLNVERNGFGVAVYNRTAESTEKYIEGPAAGKNIKPAYTLKNLLTRWKVLAGLCYWLKRERLLTRLSNNSFLYLIKVI